MKKQPTRRKSDRPRQIADAALEEFARNGYAATRVADVAKRAGISKGLMYFYFKTKEELFKAVVRQVLVPRLDHFAEAAQDSSLSIEAFLRGPFLAFAQALVRSRARVVLRLMIAEGPKHPDLTAWYVDNVIDRGLGTLRNIIGRGVRQGELRANAIETFPHLLVAPALLGVMWMLLFQRHQELDTDEMLREHVELVVRALVVDAPRQQVLL